MDIGNHTLKMAVTDDYPRIIEDNWKMTCPMHNFYWARQLVKSQPSPHPKVDEKMENLTARAFIIAHACGEWSNSPRMGHVLVSKQVKCPTISPI